MSRLRRQRPVRAVRLVLSLGLLALVAAPAWAQDDSAEQDQRIDENTKKIEALAEEMGDLRTALTVPFDAPLVSQHGLGPAASKVYNRDKGLSIGGYGEVRFRHYEGEGKSGNDDEIDALRAVIYTGYKFNDMFVLNSEIEFEHGGEEVGIEFLTLDILGWEEFNGRAGMLLVPMGFVNEQHEPTTFFGAERPEVERRILPSTWHENGVGVFGRLFDRVEYRAYVINSFDGSGFSSGGLRGGRQGGAEALANDFAFVGRIDVDVCASFVLGGSVYTGQVGQEQGNAPDAQTTIYELHAMYRDHGATVRGLFTQAFIDEAGELTDYNFATNPTSATVVAQRMMGAYAEVGYDVLPLILPDTTMSLTPFFRYEYWDTQDDVASGFTRDRSQEVDLYVGGIEFKPISQLVFKLDYRRFDPDEGKNVNQIQAGFGYVF